MAEPSLYTYPSPLEGYEGLEALPEYALPQSTQMLCTGGLRKNLLTRRYSEKVTEGPDAKSHINPPAKSKSQAYTSFPHPISNGTRGGFDIHIYYLQTNAEDFAFATALHERIRREFPELRTYRLWDKPVGPHPVAMFEVNVFTPEACRTFALADGTDSSQGR